MTAYTDLPAWVAVGQPVALEQWRSATVIGTVQRLTATMIIVAASDREIRFRRNTLREIIPATRHDAIGAELADPRDPSVVQRMDRQDASRTLRAIAQHHRRIGTEGKGDPRDVIDKAERLIEGYRGRAGLRAAGKVIPVPGLL